MGRILFILALLIVCFVVIRMVKRRLDAPKEKKIEQQEKNVVKCIHCGVHVPEHEAIKQNTQVFCSLEHAREYLEQSSD